MFFAGSSSAAFPKSKRTWGLPLSRPKKKGGAERRGLPGPHGLVSKGKGDTRDFTTSPRSVRASRARWSSALSRKSGLPDLRIKTPISGKPEIGEPRRSDQAFLLGEALLSAAGGIPHRMRRIWDTNAPDPETPVARGQRAGRSRLQPPSAAARLAKPRGHHSRSARRTLPAGRAPWWSG